MVEITKTRTQLIERAAVELGVLPSGQTLSDDDRDTIDNLIDPLLRSLTIDGTVDIQDDEAIESEYFIYVARLLANEAAPSFGQPTSAQVKMDNERMLRRLSAARPTGEVLKTQYY